MTTAPTYSSTNTTSNKATPCLHHWNQHSVEAQPALSKKQANLTSQGTNAISIASITEQQQQAAAVAQASRVSGLVGAPPRLQHGMLQPGLTEGTSCVLYERCVPASTTMDSTARRPACIAACFTRRLGLAAYMVCMRCVMPVAYVEHALSRCVFQALCQLSLHVSSGFGKVQLTVSWVY